jgi:hypothetical protein
MMGGQAALAQSVFVRAYDPLYTDTRILPNGPQGVVMGGSTFRNGQLGSDFVMLQIDSAGKVQQSFRYDHLRIDRLRFLRRLPNGGYLFGGHGWTSVGPNGLLDPDSARLVVGRLSPGFQLQDIRSFQVGTPARGGVLTGLEPTQDSGYVFSCLLNANQSNQSLLLVKVDKQGQLQGQRAFPHVQDLSLPFPNNNLIIRQNGELVAARHYLQAGDHRIDLIGLNDSLLNATPNLWQETYSAQAFYDLAYDPVEDSLGLFFRAVAPSNRYGFAKFDGQGQLAWGAEELGSPISLTPPRQVVMKMGQGRIGVLIDNRVTFWGRQGVDPRGLANPYRGRMEDFTANQGTIFLAATVSLNTQLHPLLIRSDLADTTGNCYTYYLQNARFLPLAPARPGNVLTPFLLNLNVRNGSATAPRTVWPIADSLLCIGTGNVWPGDANSDGAANKRDALYVGLAFDIDGPPRTPVNQDSNWRATNAPNWFAASGYLNGADFKHADCNGDGKIDRKDLRPIVLNYAQTHGKNAFDPCSGTDPNRPPLYLKAHRDSVTVGDTLRVWLMAGDSSRKVDSLYGVAFSLNYASHLIDSAKIRMRPISSWLAPTDSLLFLQKNFFLDGYSDVALSKAETGQQGGALKSNSHGAGPLAYFEIVTIDDLVGKRDFLYEDLALSIDNVFALTLSEQQVCFNLQADTVVLVQEQATTALEEKILSDRVRVFPNPATDLLYIQVPSAGRHEVVLWDGVGKNAGNWQGQGPAFQVSVAGLVPGLYLLQGKSEAGIWIKKVWVK